MTPSRIPVLTAIFGVAAMGAPSRRFKPKKFLLQAILGSVSESNIISAELVSNGI
jgi:hypothetical protein